MLQYILYMISTAVLCLQVTSAFADKDDEDRRPLDGSSALVECRAAEWPRDMEALRQAEIQPGELNSAITVAVAAPDAVLLLAAPAPPAHIGGASPHVVWSAPCHPSQVAHVEPSDNPLAQDGIHDVAARSTEGDTTQMPIDLTTPGVSPATSSVTASLIGLESPALALLAVAIISIAALSRRPV